ncbi:MAG: YifB family Mg chelatase-like AAA ATPase [Tyzzerella sp.]|nr:YifB family Mg chelatase-like AAA ATPase [Tyzzerella sp.]
MFSTVLSAALHGLCVEFIDVEADVSNGLPMFHLVGYLSSEVKEAGERVRTAIRNSEILLPAKKIVVNLSPADKRKRGTAFDLPIAAAILLALEEVPPNSLDDTLMIGELSLDGAVKRVTGVLPIVMEAQKRGCKKCIVPKENQEEGALVEGIQVIGVAHLKEVCAILKGEKKPAPAKYKRISQNRADKSGLDYAEIKGQHLTKRAVEVAVAGNHNLLMVGAPGAGKTAIAKRIPTILPPLTLEESMELTKIYSIMGELNQSYPLVTERPFREVHQSVTKSALLGGGTIPRPGEISLANKGVLFLDEIAEFQKSVLEMLRQPLEEHSIKILREKGEYEFPAEFIMVAAMNPCPCGNYPDLNKCNCTTAQIQSYLGRISQPFLDRIDICVEVERVPYEDLCRTGGEESSEEIQKRVVKARDIQKERYSSLGIQTNSQLSIQQVEKICVLKEEDKEFMEQVFEKMGLTARTYHKVLCVARTIADLDGKEMIEGRHLREALSYRAMNQKYWRR